GSGPRRGHAWRRAPRPNGVHSIRGTGTGPDAPRRQARAGGATRRRPTSSGCWPVATIERPLRCAPCHPAAPTHTRVVPQPLFGAGAGAVRTPRSLSLFVGAVDVGP